MESPNPEEESPTSPETEESDDGTELEFEDRVEIETTKDELWEHISDPEILASCVPGADHIERLSERRYLVELTRGVGSLTISLEGEVELVELNEPDWVLASGDAYDARSHTEFEGLGAMEMTTIDDDTVALDYRANLTFTGGVASLPKRFVGSVIRRDIDAYFDNVRETVAGTASRDQ